MRAGCSAERSTRLINFPLQVCRKLNLCNGLTLDLYQNIFPELVFTSLGSKHVLIVLDYSVERCKTGRQVK